MVSRSLVLKANRKIISLGWGGANSMLAVKDIPILVSSVSFFEGAAAPLVPTPLTQGKGYKELSLGLF